MSQGLLAGKRGLIFGVANDKSIAWACAQECAAQGAELVFNYLGPLEKRVRDLAGTIPGSDVLECDVTLDVADQIFDQPRSLLPRDPVFLGIAVAGVSEFGPIKR